MTFIIEKDEGTAARRRVPFRVFASDGTSPDTGFSTVTVLHSVNGGAQVVSANSSSIISANAGMYYIEFTQAEVATLGSMAVFVDAQTADFEQHVANVQVVNSNPMSTESHGAYLQPTVAARTLDVTAGGTAGIDWANIEAPTTEVDLSGTTIQGADRSINILQIEGLDATDQINAACDTALTDYAALQPTVAGRTLDVTATGAAGIDWANVENPATQVDLSLTTIRGSDILGLVLTDGITATSIAANAIGASELAADAASEIATSSASSVWNATRTNFIGQNSFGGIFQASTVSRLQIAGTTTEVRLGSGETTLDDFYNRRHIAIQYTNGNWVTNIISDYTGSNRSARLVFTLARAPQSGSTYILLPNFESRMTPAGALQPTVAGRTLDVTATGTAGIDWANVEGQATEVDLSLTTIRGSDLLVTNQDKTGYNVSSIDANVVDASALAADAASEIAAVSADSVWDEARADHVAAGSFGQYVNTDVIIVPSGVTVVASSLSQVADAVLSRNIAGSGQTTVRNVTNALRYLRNRVDARSSVLTVFQEDDTTSAWTASLTTGTDPSNINQINPSP